MPFNLSRRYVKNKSPADANDPTSSREDASTLSTLGIGEGHTGRARMMEAKPAVCSVTRLPEPGPYHSSRVGPGPGVGAFGDPESFDDEKARRRIVNYGPGEQTERERAAHVRAAPNEGERTEAVQGLIPATQLSVNIDSELRIVLTWRPSARGRAISAKLSAAVESCRVLAEAVGGLSQGSPAYREWKTDEVSDSFLAQFDDGAIEYGSQNQSAGIW
ncbi:hypothetical protein HPB47_014555 [Ixodes persulcatus]|uniref:Uncharacterized protein n=1 Tax=Ixodes persulcatus TaxID=34615 RepID=A0AC60R0M7_IXOPE|nr:hypothetical protein HPB47_014555 [Ixodes persulcatus]